MPSKSESASIQQLVEQYQAGQLSSLELGQQVLHASLASTTSVTPDLDRAQRCGFPEVIYGPGKSTDAIRKVAEALLNAGHEVLITRIAPEQVRPLTEVYPLSRWNSTARTLRIGCTALPVPPEDIRGNSDAADSPSESQGRCVAIVSAGTTDEPIALEARETLAWMGVETRLIQDVGVAGPYRLLAHVPQLRSMRAIVCVAGMEGALPSMLAGHVGCPVIAVPTSVGYGANFGGLSALLSMLNSCAANVAVVNIDAGFKGGYLAGLIASKPVLD